MGLYYFSIAHYTSVYAPPSTSFATPKVTKPWLPPLNGSALAWANHLLLNCMDVLYRTCPFSLFFFSFLPALFSLFFLSFLLIIITYLTYLPFFLPCRAYPVCHPRWAASTPLPQVFLKNAPAR
jgi:hypothetical protein